MANGCHHGSTSATISTCWDLDGILQPGYPNFSNTFPLSVHPAYPATQHWNSTWNFRTRSELWTSAKHLHFSWWSNVAPCVANGFWLAQMTAEDRSQLWSYEITRNQFLPGFDLFSDLISKKKTSNLMITHITHIWFNHIQWWWRNMKKKKKHQKKITTSIKSPELSAPLHASSDVCQLGSPGPPRRPCQVQGIDLGETFGAKIATGNGTLGHQFGILIIGISLGSN